MLVPETELFVGREVSPQPPYSFSFLSWSEVRPQLLTAPVATTPFGTRVKLSNHFLQCWYQHTLGSKWDLFSVPCSPSLWIVFFSVLQTEWDLDCSPTAFFLLSPAMQSSKQGPALGACLCTSPFFPLFATPYPPAGTSMWWADLLCFYAV